MASKDVIGKTVPKTRRGLASGLASAISGLGTLGVVLLFAMQPASEAHYIWLIVAGGLCWVAAAALGSFVEEQPGATEGGGNGIALALQRVSLLGRDVAFRRLVIGRALLMGTALTAPFIVLLARERSEAGLLFFLLAQGLAAMIGGPLCGIWADRSSRKLMLGMALAAGLLGLGVYLVDVFIPELTHTSWFLPATFFVLALIHDGVRMGRKTYLLDLGSGNKRTDYVAVSNTLIGVLLLFAGALASVVQAYGTVFAILMFSITAFCSIAFLWRIPEVQFDA